jgi:hypothetical protein
VEQKTIPCGAGCGRTLAENDLKIVGHYLIRVCADCYEEMIAIVHTPAEEIEGKDASVR